MRLFAIGDLHLPGGDDKPMNIFGPHWEGHFERRRTCHSCRGGYKETKERCGTCGGSGTMFLGLPCPTCNGAKRVTRRTRCPRCNGDGWYWR